MDKSRLTFGVVIPTKNRLEDVKSAVISVVPQTCSPCEIIVVDQSDTDVAVDVVKDLLKDHPGIKLKHVMRPDIKGLTEAKNAAVKIAESDVLLFIDDDIVLDERFLEVLNKTYQENTELSGVGGLVDLPGHKKSNLRQKVALIFQIGPFRDMRAVLQAGYMTDRDVIPTWLLSGGLSSLKKEVFDKVSFNDDLKGASPIEDVDFYSRASRHFKFALAPEAHALHNMSPVSRESLKRIFELKCAGFYFIFTSYMKKTLLSRVAFLWRNVGVFLDAVIASFTFRTCDPVFGVFEAWKKSFRGHSSE